MSETASSVRADGGSALLLAMPALVVVAVVGLLLTDLTAYLAAAARAQHAADAAALAAAALAHPQAAQRGDPARAADAVVRAAGARTEACACQRGRRLVRVTVSAPVRALVVTRFAARRVTAHAEATLVPP